MASGNRARTRAARTHQRRTGRSYTASRRAAAQRPTPEPAPVSAADTRATVLAVASRHGGAGASTLVANLSAAFGALGMKALAVGCEGEGRSSDAARMLGMADGDHGSGRGRWSTAPTASGGLIGAAHGGFGPAPASCLRQLVERARGEFDLVLLDATVSGAAVREAADLADHVLVPARAVHRLFGPEQFVPYREGLDRVLAELDIEFDRWCAIKVVEEDEEDGEFDFDGDYDETLAADRLEFLASLDARQAAARWAAWWPAARDHWPAHHENASEEASGHGARELSPAEAVDIVYRDCGKGLDRIDGLIVMRSDPVPASLRIRMSEVTAASGVPSPQHGPCRVLAPWISTWPEVGELYGTATVVERDPHGAAARQYLQLAESIARLYRSGAATDV